MQPKMIPAFVSKMLRISSAGGAITNMFRFTHCKSAVGSKLNPMGSRFHVYRDCAKFRYECRGKRYIRTTPQNNLHPLVWFVVRPIVKLSAMVVGRGVRKWWSQLPQNKKALFIHALSRRKFRILGVILVIGGTAFIYYETHLEDAPIINRRRFMAFNSSQILELAEFHLQELMEEFDGRIFSTNHPHHKRVQNVADRIINANRDIPEINEKSWVVTLVESSIQNSFVLPNGQIFVFWGMLDLCVNDDQLGTILGHEIAHAVLNHGAEQISYLHLLDLFTIILIGAIWAILPTDLVSALVQWMMHKLVHVLMELPYSRQLELEADEIGLNLSAKACFDVRESAAFWQRLGTMQKIDGNQTIEWLSTHPAHEARSAVLEEKLPQAISLRLTCNCPQLPALDPRARKLVSIQPE